VKQAERDTDRLLPAVAPPSAPALRRPVERWQYVSIQDIEQRAHAGTAPSVRCIGDSDDNAVAESINGLSETEARHGAARESLLLVP
jgi:hypothetical protein